MLERHIEDAIFKYPELIEPGLTPQGRQITVGGKRVDALFLDRHGYRLIVEVKRGTVVREDVAQLLDYEGHFITPTDPRTRVMLVGNRVPPNLRVALDHHGFEWRELTAECLERFLREKGDDDLAAVFKDDTPPPQVAGGESDTDRRPTRSPNTRGLPALKVATFAELGEVIRARATQCPTNYMDLLLLENTDLPLSALITMFYAVPRHAGSNDFRTVGRVKTHVNFRRKHDRWEFVVAGDSVDPVVRLTGLNR